MEKLEILTLEKEKSYEIPKIKWSRFIWHVFPISDKAEAETFLAEVKKKYYDATHNCYVYTFGTTLHTDLFGNKTIEPKYFKKSDDWEPAWTATYPIKKLLDSYKLYNVLLVVTRYFGGTKLWIGWLIQAYTESSKKVIESANILKQWLVDSIYLKFRYTESSQVMSIIEKYQCQIVEQSYWETIELKINVNIIYCDSLIMELKQTWSFCNKV